MKLNDEMMKKQASAAIKNEEKNLKCVELLCYKREKKK